MRIKYFIFILIFLSTVSEISSQSAGDLKFKHTFTPGTASQRRATDIGYQSDGKIIMVGWDGPGNNTTRRFTAIRLKTNGTEYDSTFGTNGIAMYDIQNVGYANGLAIQDDGKIVIVGFTYDGSAYDGTVIRINTDGTLDTGFSGDGIYIKNENWRFQAATIQSDGKIVVVGYDYNGDPIVVRFNSNGTLDTSFSSDGQVYGITIKGDDYWHDVQLDANQKIVVVGRAYWSSKYWFIAGRLNTDGSWDTSFDSDGRAAYDLGEESQSKSAWGIDIDSNGKILISGNSQSYPTVIRLNTNGSLDTSFDSDGISKITAFDYGEMRDIFALSNGKIAAAGHTKNSRYDFSVIMFNSNGSLDTDYGDATNDFGYSINGLGSQNYSPSNDDDYAYAADMKNDGTILIGGYDGDGTYLWGSVAYVGYTPDAPYFIDEYPSLTSTAGTTASISVKINEAGKVYYVLLANGATFPTVAEVRAGTGSGGANALQSGNQSVSANTAATVSLSSLSTQTSYDLFIIAEDNAGTPNLSDIVKKIDITTLTTTVTSITSTSNNASYKIGDVIPITVNFSENVTVSGNPQLTLETGSTDAVVNYSSGSSSNALVFNYTLASGHASSDLDYQSTSALALNSGTINDGSNNAATLTLPSPGATNSLGANKALVIDGIVPTVSSVSSSTNNGTYKIGNTIAINVTFSELVNVVTTNGTPRIMLETGSTDQYAAYFSGSGSTILTFSYTVQSGDASSDLDYQSTSALELNSGTIKDGAGNSATLTLVNPGTSNSLGVNKSIIIDGVIPTVTFSPTNNATGVQLNSNLTLTFSEAVRKIDDSALSDENVDALITLKNSNSSGSDIAFDATVNAGKTIITINPSNDFSSEQVVYVAIGATVEDGAGNAIYAANATFTGADVNATVVTFSPANGASNVSTSGNVTISFNEAVRKIDDSEITNTNVDALITLKDSNSSGSDIAFDATINAGKTLITINPTNDFSSSQVVYAAIGATVEDYANNAITAISSSFTVADIERPTIASGLLSTDNSYLDITMNEGVYNANGGSGALEKTDFILTFAQNNGNATAASIISIKNNTNGALSGGESVIRANLSITGTPSGVETVEILPESSNSIYDASGNAMATTQTTEPKILNDKLAPVFASEYPKVANVSGTSFDILVKINEGGAGYYVILANGSTAPTAAEVKAGTGNSAAAAIKSGNFALTKDTEKIEGITNLISETAYDVYILTEDGETTPNIQSSPTKIDVNTTDITFPTVSSVSSTMDNGTYKIGDVIAITITFSEAVTVTGTPQLTLETGSSDAVIDYSSGSAGILTFNYTIASDHVSGDLDYNSTSALALNSGTIKDASGNDATLTLFSPGATNSLGANKAIVVDGVVPTLSFSPVNNAMGVNINNNITITFSESIRKIDDTTLSDTNVDALITLKNTDMNGVDIAFDATIDTDKKTITIDPTTDFASEQVVYVAIGATVEDGAGNVISAANATFIIADVIAPVFASEYPKVANVSGTSFDILVKINEGGTGYYVILANGATAPTAAEVKAGTGSSAATAIKSGNFALTKDTEKSEGITGLIAETAYDVYIVTEDGETTPNIQADPTKLNVSTIDNISPTVSKINSNSVNATYITVGDTIPITITFSEIVIVTGIPQLTIETGANDALANYDIGSGSDSLIFNYIIASGDTSNDLSYVSSSALILNSGTIKDEAANEAISALPEPGATNSLSANKAIVIDAMPAMVLSVSSTSIDSIYKLGSEIPILVRFSEMVKVEGVPQIILSTGSPGDSVNYFSGSSTNELIFKYIISSGDYSSDLNYKDKTSLILNSGTIKDVAGNDAILNLVAPGVENSLGASKQLIIDGIVPSIPWVYEGSVSTDIDYQNDPSNLTLTWGEAEDAFFDTMHYEYSIGITKVGTEIKGWTNSNGQLSVQLSDLNLIENVTYYLGVKAIDGAGNISPVLQSDGITIDKTSPITSSINDGLNEDINISNSGKTISANWLQFSDATSYIKEYEYAVGTTANGIDVKTWTSIGVDTSFVDSSFQLIHAQNYFVSVKATDAANNVSKTVSSDGFMVDLYPGSPSVSSISLSNGSYLPLIDDIVITIDFSESISDYELSMSSKLNNSVINSHSKDVNQITLNIIAPLTSLDTISLSISNVTDLVGNVSDNIEYQFPTSLIGDFTGEQNIDASDLSTFLTGWNNNDVTYELGPVVGSPPHFTIQKDGKYDLRDLMAIIRIWDWSQTNLSKVRARQFEQIGDSINHDVLDKNISLFIPTKVSAVDLIIDYPTQYIKFESLENITIPQKVFLSHHDTTNSLIKIAAGYLDPKSKIINLPYYIFGKENVPININYRMLDNNGYIIGQGERTIQLIAIPNEYRLEQNYPNPFNPVTTINFDLPKDAYVNLIIYDVLGREVVKLVSEEIPGGYQSVQWNTRNNFGEPVSAGIYFYQLQTKDFVKTRKMVLLK